MISKVGSYFAQGFTKVGMAAGGVANGGAAACLAMQTGIAGIECGNVILHGSSKNLFLQELMQKIHDTGLVSPGSTTSRAIETAVPFVALAGSSAGTFGCARLATAAARSVLGKVAIL